jgi:DNA-binding HxlR family transcriptional regulator
MPQKKRREQKDSEPDGKTKINILLYFAEHPNEKILFSSIKEHLTETFNIRNDKTIRTHLKDLKEIDLIDKTPYSRGSSDEYYLSNDFERFKKLYFHFKEYDSAYRFLKTGYFLYNIQSKSFQQKFFINQFIDSTIKFNILINKKELFESARIGETEERINEINEAYRKQTDNQSFKRMVELLTKYDVDTLYKDVIYASIQNTKSKYDLILDLAKGKIPIEIYQLALLCQNIIPKEDEAKVNEIIKESPTVIEFMLNSNHTSFLIMHQITQNHMKYYNNLFYKEILETQQTHGKKLNSKEIDLLNKLSNNTKNKEEYDIIGLKIKENPLIFIIKSLFIYDIINENTLSGNISEDLLKYTFSQQKDSETT